MARPDNNKVDNAFAPEVNTQENAEQEAKTQSASDELDAALAGAEAAVTKNAENQAEFNNEAKGSNKPKKSFAKGSEAILGTVDAKLNTLNARNQQAQSHNDIVQINSKTARILGYIVKTDERIDFAKKVTKKEDGSEKKVGWTIKNYGPSPVAGVIVGCKTDILNQLGKSSEDHFDLKAEDVEAAKSSSAYTITVINKANNELWDWICTKTAGYINEEEELFVPYKKYSKGKDGVTKALFVDTWDASASADPALLKKKYSTTGGKAGICALVKQRGSKGTTAGNVITYKQAQDIVLTPVLSNTARPKLGLAVGNYIAATKYDTVPVATLNISDEKSAMDYTHRYFDRWLKAKKDPVIQSEWQTDTTISDVILSNGSSEPIANCFAPGSYMDFWKNVKVAHWYDVDDATKAAKLINSKDIELVDRVSSFVTKDKVQTQVFKVNKVMIDTDKYPFDVPAKIAAAINKIQPGYLTENLGDLKEAVTKISTAKTTTSKASTGAKTRMVLGSTFAKILSETQCSTGKK